MKGQKTTNFFVISTVTFLVIVFLCSQAKAKTSAPVTVGELSFDSFASSEAYTSPILKTDFAFNIIGFAWQGESIPAVDLRFYNNQGWSSWYSLEASDYIEKGGWQISVEPWLADQAEKFQYRLAGQTAPDRLKFIYLNSSNLETSGFNFLDFFLHKASAASNFEIISRTQWEADESWRYKNNEELWPPEYQYPEKIVIHHTAGDPGLSDPAGTVRGVYYWHAVVLGWGDIGYNYLVDQNGNIYEGRMGGEGVIGAHVYRDANCAKQRFGGADHEANFNKGTVGVAILGNYQNLTSVNAKVKDSLAGLIAKLGVDYGLEPQGDGYFIDGNYPNVVGHRDLDCTDCPGKTLYNELSNIRQAAQAKYIELGGPVKSLVKAIYVGQSEQPVVINAGEVKEIWVDFRNDGNATWRNYTSNTLSVLAKSDQSNFYVAGWSSATQVARLETPNVAPGETGRFVFSIKAPMDQMEVSENFSLEFGEQVLGGTDFTVTAQITGFDNAAALDNQTIAPATFIKARQKVVTQFKNRGRTTWEHGEVKLNIYDLGYQVSRFYDTAWPNQSGQIDFQEAEVKPNELATFTFYLTSPLTPGLYKNIYKLTGPDGMVQQEDYSITRVDSMHRAELSSYTMPPAMLNVWRLKPVIKLKNIGSGNWDRNTVLKIYDLGDDVSRFHDNSWIDNYTAARLSEAQVKPGETGTFTFYFRAPREPGLYLNRFELVAGGLPVPGGSFIQITRVDK
ncbi:MAG: N-acetylmuramoyl-L-alanine amidase [Patescibacteria group bacterium]|jgi:hypothetical protein